MSGSARGRIELVDGNRIFGWAFDPAHPDERVAIGIHLGGACLFTVQADRFREDLLAAGHGDGFHAFEAIIPAELFAAPFLVLQVRFGAAGAELAGSPVEVETRRIYLTDTALTMLGESIASFSAGAQTTAAVDWLHQWLLQQQQTLFARRTELARLELASELSFGALLNHQGTLGSLMQEAARATVNRYDALHLADGPDPDVTVIVPAFNQFAYTHRCLASMLAHKPQARFEVVVVDDGSTDETLYAGLVCFGAIRIVRNARNAGFLAAVTAGAQAAQGRYLLLLNNDTEVGEGWLDALLQTFALDPQIGIAGSKLLFPDGRLQEAGGIVWRDGVALNYGYQDDPTHPRYCYMRDADYVSGAALMIERALFNSVGGLSAEFAPGYYEDTDLCFKVRAAGRRVVMQPYSVVTHHGGITAGTDVAGPQMKRFQRLNHRKFLVRWGHALRQHGLSTGDPHAEAGRWMPRRVLFVDNTTPTPDQDAGSNAAIQFMMSFQRLGYHVCFAGVHNMAKISPYTEALERIGIECFYHPHTRSLETVINEATRPFDVIFVHRLTNMQAYYAQLRDRFPDAVIMYGVADIHHLRLAREAKFKHDASLAREAKALAPVECAMAAAADAVVVHSSFEASHIKRKAPGAAVHTIPWAVPACPTKLRFAARKGIAFIGGYAHTPNVDAAVWLVNDILPLVWAENPAIECLLIGSQMPPDVLALAQERVRVMGHVPALQPVLDGLRLTVAPLRYGAGMKGKVLTSLAAGAPCVGTPCAVEGMDLPAQLDVLVGQTAQALADAILLAYGNEQLNTELGAAGLQYIADVCSPRRIDALLGAAMAQAQAAKHPHPAPEAHGRHEILASTMASR